VVTTRSRRKLKIVSTARLQRPTQPDQLPFSRQQLLRVRWSDAGLSRRRSGWILVFFRKFRQQYVRFINHVLGGFEHIALGAAAAGNPVVLHRRRETVKKRPNRYAAFAGLLRVAPTRLSELVERVEREDLSPTCSWRWQVASKCLGILGMERVGQAVAPRPRGFRNEIHSSDAAESLPADRKAMQATLYHKDPSACSAQASSLSFTPGAPQNPASFLGLQNLNLCPPALSL